MDAASTRKERFAPDSNLERIGPLTLSRAHLQVELPFEAPANTSEYGLTFRDSKKEPYHRWYPYVEGFSAPYVRSVLERFGPVGTVLDPFGGAGTTQVETSANGVTAFYSELNPFMRFVADTKVNSSIWAREHLDLMRESSEIFLEVLYSPKFNARVARTSLDEYLHAFEERDYFEEKHLRELLAARDIVAEVTQYIHARSILTLAVASNVVKSSNMTRRADLRRRRTDEYKDRVVDVRGFIREKVFEILEDLQRGYGPRAATTFICENAKSVGDHIENIDIAITSPPYLNGTNYCRNTKLEQWLLGWLRTESDLRHFRDHAVAAGINNVNSKRKVPHQFDSVERIGKALDKTEGDRRIPQLVRNYFSDMFEVLVSVHNALRDGGRFVLDIGDSKFYGVHVPTDVLLAEVASEAGFEVESSRKLARRYSYDRTELHQVELTFRKPIARVVNPGKRVLSSLRPSQKLQTTIERFGSDLPYKHEPYCNRSWGHPLHSLCCYQGKLKPAIAHALVSLFTSEGMSVLDPLGGVGTVALEACLQGRLGITNDLSPLAYSVATPKVRFPKLADAQFALEFFQSGLRRIALSESDFEAARFGLNGTVADYYHEHTLVEVLKARKYFLGMTRASDADLLVKAATLHVLHGNRPYALSRTSHPITPFHPSGKAVYKPVAEHVRRRILQLYRRDLPKPFLEGHSYHLDFRALPTRQEIVDSIITSPPFWGMRFDRPNWLRMWFCGWDAEDFHVTSRAFLERQQTASLEVYREFFGTCRRLLRPGGLMILHLGGSDKHEMLATLLAQAKDYFQVLSLVAEDSTKHERHGIKDKGLTKTHNFIFLQ